MKSKIFTSVFLFLLLLGCDDIPGDVVDANQSGIQAKKIVAPQKVIYSVDPEFLSEVSIEGARLVNSLWFNLYFAEGRKEEVASGIKMFDDGELATSGDKVNDDNIFSGKFEMPEEYTTGRYQAEYIARDIYGNTSNLGSVYFEFETTVQNAPPVLSDLVLQDTVRENQYFSFSVKVEDPNGIGDISRVYFLLFRPDGSNIQPNGIDMKDDGNSDFGDAVAGDGIYSFRNTFGGEGLQYGTWKFEFYAKDKSGSLSNLITHNIEVTK